MIRISLFSILFFVSVFTVAAQDEAAKVAQQQLDAYNAQDLDAFVAVFAEDAEIFSNLEDSVPSYKGHKQIRKVYGDLFERYPDNKSILIGRMQQGNFVFDHELLVGRDKEVKIVAIYEVEAGKIIRCWFVR